MRACESRELSERVERERELRGKQWRAMGGREWGGVSGVPWQEPARTSGSGHKNEATGNGGRAHHACEHSSQLGEPSALKPQREPSEPRTYRFCLVTDLIAPPYRSPSTGTYSPNIADAD